MNFSRCATLLAAILLPVLLQAAVIGPDSFGYTARSNTDPGGIPLAFSTIAGTGSLLLTGDDNVTSVTLGSSFGFYGSSYSSVTVSTNGNLQFASSKTDYSNTALIASGFGPTIFAFWDDLQFGGAGQGAFYQYFASGVHPNLSGPTSVFEWTGGYYQNFASTTVRVQALLEHNTGRILTQYSNTSSRGTGTSATIGIQNGSGTSLEWLFDGTGQLVPSQSTILFSAVPETQSAVLVSSGLSMAILWRRRRARSLAVNINLLEAE